MSKRYLEVAVISDTHLGTFGCQAKELNNYLKSIKPKTLILNGDIIDIWNFRKNYFPSQHMKVIRQLFHMAAKGTEVIYITGNHDELLRKFTDLDLGNIKLCNKHVLDLNGDRAWVFHGDVFDGSVHGAKLLAKLGGVGYDMLIRINSWVNYGLEKLGREKYSFSKRIKNSVKKAVKYIGDFENTAAELAIDQGFDYVVCGHIHQPQMRSISNKKGKVMYLNSGDWIENLTALEYSGNAWKMYSYNPEEFKNMKTEGDSENAAVGFEELISLVNPLK
jgi:UDP-2,3-diacylglucosamine pyrophosphatase LpxH